LNRKEKRGDARNARERCKLAEKVFPVIDQKSLWRHVYVGVIGVGRALTEQSAIERSFLTPSEIKTNGRNV